MILEKLISMVSEQLDLDKETLSAETSLDDDLGVDSLDVVEMLMDIQNEFDIEIDDDDIENIKTLGDLADYIAAQND